jgi:hypothetical protein
MSVHASSIAIAKKSRRGADRMLTRAGK